MKPFLAIWMVTYNHENYICQAIDSVLMQKTNFGFKLFIGEDCSTDKTREICIEYAQKYPDRIELVLHEKNIGSTANGIFMYDKCFKSGAKYVALLEGDDYWTDPLKLQKQVDFLEANPQYALVVTNLNFYFQNKGVFDYSLLGTKKFPVYTKFESFLWNRGYMAPCTWLGKKEIFDIPALKDYTEGSFLIFAETIKNYKVYFLDIVTAVYRRLDESTSHPPSMLHAFLRERDLFSIEKYLLEKYNQNEYLEKFINRHISNTAHITRDAIGTEDVKKILALLKEQQKEIYEDVILEVFDILDKEVIKSINDVSSVSDTNLSIKTIIKLIIKKIKRRLSF